MLIAFGCSPNGGGIPFHGDAALLDSFEWDSGLVPESSGAQVRVVVRGGGGAAVDARGAVEGGALTATPGSGKLAVEGSLTLEVHAKVDVASVQYEGIVEEVGYALPLEEVAFEPFLTAGEAPAIVESVLPEDEILRAPIPSVPGSTLVLSITGGQLTTTFAGTCARLDGGYAQYLGHVAIGGTIEVAATVEIEVPVVGSRSFGPFDIAIPLEDIERDVDLGTFEVSSGTRVESGPSPCNAVAVGDAGVPMGDGAVQLDGGELPLDGDLPMRDGGGEVCASPRQPPETGALCDYATGECLATASTREAQQACFAADGAPEPCEQCIRDEQLACIDAACPAEFQAVMCCARAHCSTLEGDRFQSCLDAFCVDETDAYLTCASSSSCNAISAFCFRRPAGG